MGWLVSFVPAFLGEGTDDGAMVSLGRENGIGEIDSGVEFVAVRGTECWEDLVRPALPFSFILSSCGLLLTNSLVVRPSRIGTQDITLLPLPTLRSRLTLIPQEAVLFSGTVLTNLDPFSLYSQAECLSALERVGLGGGTVGLESKVAAGGHNFSAGQRQLLAMARAVLGRCRVVVMDEVSAGI